MKTAISCCIALFTALPGATAQDACVALLRHGIYNTLRSTQQGASSSTVYNQICTNYSLYKSGRLAANANGSYGLFSASAGFSQEQVEAIGQAMCASNYSDADASSHVDSFSSIVSKDGTDAFNQCIKNANAGLIVQTSFDESIPEIVKIDAHYSRIGLGPNLNRVRGIEIKDSSGGKYPITCDGSLKDAADHKNLITSGILTVTCRRPVENDPGKSFPIAGNAGGLAFPGSVTIATDVGSIFFAWGPLYLPPPISPIPPAFVGEIRAVSFQPDSPGYAALSNNGWIECDGRVLNGADYPELYKALGNTWGTTNLGATFKIPDLRGEFLRGWSHGSNVDPDASNRGSADPGNTHPGWTGASGDSVGSRQTDALLQHAHAIQGLHLEAKAGDGFDGTGLDTNSNKGTGWTKTMSSAGTDARSSNAETRPKNVSVMYVIYLGKKAS